MAVPSSGELRLYADIGVELGVPQSDVSLGSMSDSAGFAEPDAMSDFYGYVDAVAPSVTTNAISNVGQTSLRANGNVTSDGGGTITERGFYVGTNSASPTNNTKYTVSGTTGSYLRNISGLSSYTTYYCWAFATNSAGTTYGSRVAATTLSSFVPTYALHNATNWYTKYTNYTGGGLTASLQHTKSYIDPITSGLVTFYSNNVSPYVANNANYTHNTNLPNGGGSWCTNATNEFKSYCAGTGYHGGHHIIDTSRYPGSGAPTFSNAVNAATFGASGSLGPFDMNSSSNGNGFNASSFLYIRFTYV